MKTNLFRKGKIHDSKPFLVRYPYLNQMFQLASLSSHKFGTSQARNFIGVLEERHGAIAQTFQKCVFLCRVVLKKGNALRPASYLDVPGS